MMLKYKCRVGIKSLANERPGLTHKSIASPSFLLSCKKILRELLLWKYENSEEFEFAKKINHPIIIC